MTTKVVIAMTENNPEQYNESYSDSDDFDIDAQREQWAREREEMRAEEQQNFLKERHRYLPLYTVLILAGFLILAIIPQETVHDIIYSHEFRGNSGRNLIFSLFLTVWFGSIADTTHLSKLKHEPLMKNCIAIISCALLSMFVMLFSFTNLTESMAAIVFGLSKVIAAAGAAFTVYPLKYIWTLKRN